MKHVLAIAFILSAILTRAQVRPPVVDKSPMDMSYYPVNYPILKIQEKLTEPLVARVIYSRPQKNGRGVFGELLEYGKIWRLGANEATEIEFFKDVKVNGARLKKGRYSLYCLPTSDKWTLIFNKETDTWGAFKYDSSKDVLRTAVSVLKQTEAEEVFSLWFEKAGAGANLNILWDTELIKMPVTF
ncbi:MAG: DUF2911 domain-containing protein [Chitinophagaceae bacterium]|nr:DUF2911 domain-containing protein [Chitinophagaceae bacterium]